MNHPEKAMRDRKPLPLSSYHTELW